MGFAREVATRVIFIDEGKIQEENVPEEYNSLFEEIEAAQKRVAEIKEQIAYTKGGKACPKCGAVVSGGAAFCSTCGAKMDEDIFEEEEVDTDEKTEDASEETVETVSGEVVEEEEE